MLLEVNTTKVKQEGNTVLDTKEKTLYYLLIGVGQTKAVINVGEKNYVGVSKLLAEGSKNIVNK
jgi:hypothetical protein